MEELETRQERDPQPLRQSVLEWAEVVVGSVVVVTLLLTFLCRIITVDGSSMNPTYENGDRVLVTNLAGPVEQGDVVIVVNALEEPIIKRVVATQGQVVDFDPALGEVTVDGEPCTGRPSASRTASPMYLTCPGRCWSSPRPCRKAASLCWGTTGRIPRTAALPRWAWWTAGTFWGKWCSTCSP